MLKRNPDKLQRCVRTKELVYKYVSLWFVRRKVKEGAPAATRSTSPAVFALGSWILHTKYILIRV